jgi:hypothetical protein
LSLILFASFWGLRLEFVVNQDRAMILEIFPPKNIESTYIFYAKDLSRLSRKKADFFAESR